MLEVPGNNQYMSVAEGSEVPRQPSLPAPTHLFSTGDHMPQTLPRTGRVPGEPKRVKCSILTLGPSTLTGDKPHTHMKLDSM